MVYNKKVWNYQNIILISSVGLFDNGRDGGTSFGRFQTVEEMRIISRPL